jgi:hypothetical protein
MAAMPHRRESGAEFMAQSAVRDMTARAWWRKPWVEALAALLVMAAVCFAVAAIYIVRHAEPVLRRSVVESLEAKFHSPVELDELHVYLLNGVEVRGHGLRILSLAGPDQPGLAPNATPMLSVDTFKFHTSLHDLVLLQAHIARVDVDGLELHVPHDRHGLMPQSNGNKPRIRLTIGEIHCEHAKLIIDTTKPGKEPLEFDIENLVLKNAGAGRAMDYVAEVINPKPVGAVRAVGHFGPWDSEDPRSSPLDGDYSFEHADLSTIKGIGGMLSSTGHFYGELGNITIDGTTQTPDFTLDVSGHSEPLETRFHAIVDGTSGDTTLAPVQATLEQSQFTAAGTVVNIRGQGHDIALDIDMPKGRIEDLLQLGMKTEPPVMHGAVTMKAKLHIPPGKVRVAQKLGLAGNLRIQNVEFNNPHVQDRVDGLSLRAQGKPKDVKAAETDNRPQVSSQMAVTFSLGDALMTVNSLQYEIPGVKVTMDGVYSLDGNLFEFKGHVRTDAMASQMVTGWKSALLTPFDPLFRRGGAGLELPISVSGTKGDVHFGLAMRGADESPQDMAAGLKAKRREPTSP